MDAGHVGQVHLGGKNSRGGVGRGIAKPGTKIVGWWNVTRRWLCDTCGRHFDYSLRNSIHELPDGGLECTDCYSGRVDYAHDYYQFDDVGQYR